MATQEITAADDLEALLSQMPDRPVLVMFKADWCRVCMVLRGQIEEMMRTAGRPGQLALVDVERLAAVAHHYDIRHLPTLIVFDHGHCVARHVGHRPPEVMRHLLATALSGVSSSDDALSGPL